MMSLVESSANVLIGLLVAVAVQIFVFPSFGLQASFAHNVLLTLVVTGVSIARSYMLRRTPKWGILPRHFWGYSDRHSHSCRAGAARQPVGGDLRLTEDAVLLVLLAAGSIFAAEPARPNSLRPCFRRSWLMTMSPSLISGARSRSTVSAISAPTECENDALAGGQASD
jgi:hypothetical protein